MKLNDKIRAALTGFAYGDALGLGTEFMTRAEVRSYYPDGLRTFKQIIRDSHRVQWKRGDVTNDTETLMVFLEAVIANGGFDLDSQAHAFKDWLEKTEVDVAPNYRVVCNTPGWLDHPISTAHEAWRKAGFPEASNEGIQRAVLTGLVSDEKDLAENTRKSILMTHDDSRCVASATVLAKMVHSLFYKDRMATYDELINICQSIDPRTTSYLQKAYDDDIDDLGIDDPSTMQWTRKTMSVAIWALLHTDNCSDAIHKTVDLGGDADTNASLVGAMAGLKYGYDALPAEHLKLNILDEVLDLADRLTQYLEQKKLQLSYKE